MIISDHKFLKQILGGFVVLFGQAMIIYSQATASEKASASCLDLGCCLFKPKWENSDSQGARVCTLPRASALAKWRWGSSSASSHPFSQCLVVNAGKVFVRKLECECAGHKLGIYNLLETP